jgi:hypothetical protein
MTDHFRRVYKIEIPPTEPIPSLRQLVKKQIESGALWSDLIEVKHGDDRIVVFGLMSEVYHRKSAPLESAE